MAAAGEAIQADDRVLVVDDLPSRHIKEVAVDELMDVAPHMEVDADTSNEVAMEQAEVMVAVVMVEVIIKAVVAAVTDMKAIIKIIFMSTKKNNIMKRKLNGRKKNPRMVPQQHARRIRDKERRRINIGWIISNTE